MLDQGTNSDDEYVIPSEIFDWGCLDQDVWSGCYPKHCVKTLDDGLRESEQQEKLEESAGGYLLPTDVLNNNSLITEFIVLHSFCDSIPDTLTLEKGDIVKVTEITPSGWSWVKNEDHDSGWFPTEYLKPLECSPSPDAVYTIEEKNSFDEDDHDNGRVLEDAAKLHGTSAHENEYVPAHPAEVEAIRNKGSYEEYEAVVYRASHSYKGSDKNELSFKENEAILVLEEREEGWWRGTTSSGEGWFPVTYVEGVSAGENVKTIETGSDERHSEETEENHYEDMNYSCKDATPYHITDLILGSTKHKVADERGQTRHHSTHSVHPETVNQNYNPKKLTKAKRRRPPPAPPVNKETSNQEIVTSNRDVSGQDEEGVVILRPPKSSDDAVSKLIKITKRRSSVNPDQSYLGPPPSRPVPVAPARMARKAQTLADTGTKKLNNRARCFLPQTMIRNQENNLKIQPERPPPPTPKKLKEYKRRHAHEVSVPSVEDHKQRNQDRPQPRLNMTDEQSVNHLRNCKSEEYKNKISLRTDDEILYENQRTRPKPRQRILSPSNDRKPFAAQHLLNDKKLTKLSLCQSSVHATQHTEAGHFAAAEDSSGTRQFPDRKPSLKQAANYHEELYVPMGAMLTTEKPAVKDEIAEQMKDTELEFTASLECSISRAKLSSELKPRERTRIKQSTLAVTTEASSRSYHTAAEHSSSTGQNKAENAASVLEKVKQHRPQVTPRVPSSANEVSPPLKANDGEDDLKHTRTRISEIESRLHPGDNDAVAATSTSERHIQPVRSTITHHATGTSSGQQPLLDFVGTIGKIQKDSLQSKKSQTTLETKPKPKTRTKKC